MAFGRTPALPPRYPLKALTNPEILHWYAHTVWSDNWQASAEILEMILPYRPHDGDLLYDLACARSLSNDLAASEEFLKAAIEADYRDWDHMASDPDLRNLRASRRFAKVMQAYGR